MASKDQNAEQVVGRSDDVQGSLALGPDSAPNVLERARQDRNTRMANAAEELERLRLLRSEIEQQHVELSELGLKQDAYQRSKREVSQNLDRALASLEKRSTECARSLDVIDETRKAFLAQLSAIQNIEESQWGAAGFEESLNRAFRTVDEAENVYSRAMSKIEALIGPDLASPSPSKARASKAYSERLPGSFLFWLKAGFAFTLPLVVAVCLLCMVLLYLNGY